MTIILLQFLSRQNWLNLIFMHSSLSCMQYIQIVAAVSESNKTQPIPKANSCPLWFDSSNTSDGKGCSRCVCRENFRDVVTCDEKKQESYLRLKGKDEIDDGARGQLEKYLQLVLQEQPFRTSVYGFLTDNISLHLVIATRTKDAIRTDWILDVSWNTTDSGVQAAKVVSCLASMSLTELHYHLPSVVVVEQGKVELQGVLGNGLSGFVYKGKLGETTLVVKVFKDLERLSREERMLRKLRRSNVLHIPSINAVAGNALLLTPLARSFVSVGETGPFLAPLHIQQMVETLHQAHCCDIVHRDVRSANIYAVTKHEVLLNDWGSSCMRSVGECIPYEGVIAEASDHILALLIDGKHVVVRPNDDLHALARTVYRILFKPPPHMIASTMEVEGLKKIKQFWNDCGRSWQEIFELAERAVVQDRDTYKLFEDALCGILHVVDVHTWAEWSPSYNLCSLHDVYLEN